MTPDASPEQEWTEMDDNGFIAFVGPFFHSGVGATLEIATSVESCGRIQP